MGRRLSCAAMLRVLVHLLQLGGGVSAKELLAAREDAERRAEMAQSRAAGSSWSAPRPRTSPPPAPATEKPSNGAANGAPGASLPCDQALRVSSSSDAG